MAEATDILGEGSVMTGGKPATDRVGSRLERQDTMTTLLTFPAARPRVRAGRVMPDLTGMERRSYSQIPATMDYVYHPSFASPLPRRGAVRAKRPRRWRSPPGPTSRRWPRRCRRSGRTAGRLSAAGEARLFLQYNYARYRLARLIGAQRRRKSAVRAQADDRLVPARAGAPSQAGPGEHGPGAGHGQADADSQRRVRRAGQRGQHGPAAERGEVRRVARASSSPPTPAGRS